MKSILVSMLVLLGTIFVLPENANASHFRFGHMTWKRISNNSDGSVTVEFRFLQAWRASAPDMLGINFGDGDSFFPSSSDITDIGTFSDLAGEGYITRVFTSQHTYSATSISTYNGSFLAEGSSCCRIGSLVNAGDGSMRVSSIVDLKNNNNFSPIGSTPVILQVSFGKINTLQLPIADADGDPLTCRMASNSESFINSIASVGGKELAVSPNCVLSWDLTALTASDIGKKYAAQVVIEEANRCTNSVSTIGGFSAVGGPGSTCGSVALDFILEVVEGNAPACSSNQPTSNTLYANLPFTANFTGTDLDANEQLTVFVSGTPAGSTFSPASGSTSAAPVVSTFSWTPTVADKGTVASMLVTYQDAKGLQGICSLALQVSQLDVDCAGTPGGSAKLDRCNVCAGDGTSCLGCVTKNNRAGQLAVDGTSLSYTKLINSIANSYLAAGGKRSTANSIKAQSVQNHRSAWTTIWTAFPSQTTTCSNTTFCTQAASYSSELNSLSVSSANQEKLARSMMRKLSRSRRAAFEKRLKDISSKYSKALATIPATQSSCN